MTVGNSRRSYLFAFTAALALVGTTTGSHAGSYETLLSFDGAANGSNPLHSPLVRDTGGNLYGTTVAGGGTCGCGVVFELAPDGTETVLHTFSISENDGNQPNSGVVRDKSGNLYGTTFLGGANGDGSAFALTPDGTLSILHSFEFGSPGGEAPVAGLVRDRRGNLYGTTYGDGAGGDYGSVFKIAADGTFTSLYSFKGGRDGNASVATLTIGPDGDLYGTTVNGGTNEKGDVFKVSPQGKETIVYTFKEGRGAFPGSSIIFDASGNMYGTTGGGGKYFDGTIFEITAAGSESVLHSFSGGTDGGEPSGGLVMDASGNLYGTTLQGGDTSSCQGLGCGVVYELPASGKLAVLHAFEGGADGAAPAATLIADGKGHLYGTTTAGGTANAGTVFRVSE